MDATLGLLSAAPLDPYQARARLLFTLVLLSELGAVRMPANENAKRRLPPSPAGASAPRPIRRRSAVRPPRAC